MGRDPEPPELSSSADIADAEGEFFQRIERHFGIRRGGPVMLSPRDWRLVEEWHAAGIPLAVVLRGINRAFDRFSDSGPRPDRINSLRYCKQEIAQTWEEHRGAGQPTSAASGLANAAAHLRACASACRRATQGERDGGTTALDAVGDALEALATRAESGEVGAADIAAEASRLEAALWPTLDADSAGIEGLRATLGIPRFDPYAF